MNSNKNWSHGAHTAASRIPRIGIVCLLVVPLMLALSGCVTLAQVFSGKNTEPAKIDYHHVISNSPQALACSITPGGACPAGVALPSAAGGGPPALAFTWSDLNAKKPTAESIKAGRNFLNGLSGTASLSQSQAVVIDALGVSREQLTAMAANQSDTVSTAAVQGASIVAQLTTGHPVTNKFISAYYFALGITPPSRMGVTAVSGTDSSMLSVDLERAEVNSYFEEVEQATATDGWANFAASEIGLSLSETDPQIKASELSLARLGVFVQEYMSAYFRSGHFVQFDLDATASKAALVSRINNALGIRTPTPNQQKVVGDAAQEMIDSLLGKSTSGSTYQLFGSLADGAFVTRGGTSYSFPSINVRVTPLGDHPFQATKVDYTAVGADMVRIFFEALGDSIAGLPSDPKSTACKSAHRLLPCFVEHDPTMGNLSADAFGNVNQAADRAEGVLGMAAARAIRRISWFSLNNEALAELIDTALAVSIRKATEKLVWCAYACGVLPDSIAAAGSTPKQPAAQPELASTDASVRTFAIRIR